MNGLYDIHCHILPGVDDGSGSMEESLWLLKKEYDEGVRNIILTPHFRYKMIEPSLEKVQLQFLRLLRKTSKIGPDLKLYLGCELHASMDMIDCLKKGERMTMASSRYVLVEFSDYDEKNYIKERIQKLKLNGYLPIVAHVERYRAAFEDADFIGELRDMGAYIQMNADSITGRDGLRMKWFCKKLLKWGLVDFIGSDGHNAKDRIPEIGKAYDLVEKLMGRDYADTIFIENPSKITG